MKQTKIDTLFKAQTRKTMPFARKKTKAKTSLNGSTLYCLCNITGKKKRRETKAGKLFGSVRRLMGKEREMLRDNTNDD